MADEQELISCPRCGGLMRFVNADEPREPITRPVLKPLMKDESVPAGTLFEFHCQRCNEYFHRGLDGEWFEGPIPKPPS